MKTAEDMVDELLEANDEGIKRDQYGRPVLADPTTGEIMPWWRISSYGDLLNDPTGLSRWMVHNIIFAIGRNPDLYALAASAVDISDKDTLKAVAEMGAERAGQSVAANTGSASHLFEARIDRGEADVHIPEEFQPANTAYRAAMAEYEIEVFEDYIERFVIVPDLQAAGSLDRLYTSKHWGLPRVGDLKFGKDVKGKMLQIAVQLALYANATHWYDARARKYYPMPDVDKETAIVAHVPQNDGKCYLYEVDIKTGLEAAKVCQLIRALRKRKDLSVPLSRFEPVPVANGFEPPLTKWCSVCKNRVARGHQCTGAPEEPRDEMLEARRDWLRGRIAAVIEAGEKPKADLVDVWRQSCPEIPKFSQGGPISHEQIDRVAGACHVVEMAHQLPFYEPDPLRLDSQPNTQMKVQAILK